MAVPDPLNADKFVTSRRAFTSHTRTPPKWVATLVNADAAAGGALTQTLRAVADADINMQKAARILGKHPNTVYSRIERIRELTGLDGQHHHDLTELLLGLDCVAADKTVMPISL